MRTIRLIISSLLSCLLLLSFNLFGQDRLINPTPTFLQLLNNVPNYKCSTFNIQQMIDTAQNDVLNGKNPFDFAKKFDVSLSPINSGVWEELDGLMIWRLRIESQQAFSMMLILEELNLPPYSSLFFYNDSMTYILGPYTETYNENQILPTPLIPGSSVIVELVYEKDSLQTPPSFIITNISHDFCNLFGYFNLIKEDGIAGDLLECHIDINCPE